MLALKASLPTATFSPPVVLVNSALAPYDIFPEPVVLAPKALDHLLNKHNYQNHDIHSKSFEKAASNKTIPGHSFKVCLKEADLTKSFSILKKEDFIINQLLGSKKENWASNLTPIKELVIHDVYPKTDLKLYFKGSKFFTISPYSYIELSKNGFFNQIVKLDNSEIVKKSFSEDCFEKSNSSISKDNLKILQYSCTPKNGKLVCGNKYK